MNSIWTSSGSIENFIAAYRNDADHNDAVWKIFSQMTDEHQFLREHRDWFEERKFGFGDRAFHYMWLLILKDVARRSGWRLDLLEIGVFKGQVISLWSLIAKRLNRDTAIVGITPLSGKPPLARGLHRLRMTFDRTYREDAIVGNLHHASDFRSDIWTVFRHFELESANLAIIPGLSQDKAVWSQVSDRVFDVVYIDGGHRYDEVSADLAMYAPLVRPSGYLVVDDAAFFQPGTLFFKGFEGVSRAANELSAEEWVNVLNVGHNRIFQRRADSA